MDSLAAAYQEAEAIAIRGDVNGILTYIDHVVSSIGGSDRILRAQLQCEFIPYVNKALFCQTPYLIYRAKKAGKNGYLDVMEELLKKAQDQAAIYGEMLDERADEVRKVVMHNKDLSQLFKIAKMARRRQYTDLETISLQSAAKYILKEA